MEDKPNQKSDSSSSSPGGDFSQEEIDSIVNGGGAQEAETPPPAQAEASDASSEGVTQADIDALLQPEQANSGATGEASSSPPEVTSPAPPDASTNSNSVSQNDIDALLASASGAVADADAAPSDGAESGASRPDGRVDSEGRPFDEAAAAMAAAIDTDKSSQGEDTTEPDARPPELAELGGSSQSDIDAERVSMLSDVNLRVKIELGSTQMLVEEVLKLGEGSVVELDKLAGDPVDVFVNSRLIARGEVLVLNDNFCVRISEVISHDPHRITA